MNSKIILIFLMSWGNRTHSYKIGDEEKIPKQQAIGIINAGIAKAKVKKEGILLQEAFENESQSQAEAEAEAKAILEREHLENELNGLYSDVVLKEAELNGVILDAEQILEMVEELKKRILPLTNDEKEMDK